MGDRRGTVRNEEDSARGSIYPLQSLGPSSRPCILAKTPRGLNLGTSQITPDTGTGSGYPNRTFDSSFAQPSAKQGSQCLTLFQIGEAYLHS